MEQFITFTLFGGAVWFVLAVVGLLVALFASEYHENGFGATISIIIALVVNYVWGDFPIMEYVSWGKIGVYIGIGFVFSFLRTYFKGRELSSKYKKYLEKFESKDSQKEPKTKPEFNKEKFDLKGHVFRWWFLFPVSMLSWFFGSLLKDLGNAVYAKIGKLYEKVLNL
jgi:hypothetical protein